MGKDCSLTYKNQHGEERVWPIEEGIFRIGRLDDNDLAFENPYISRYHVEITNDGSSFHLRDLGSTSGTFVNGDRVRHRNLKDGDQIRLGRGRGVEFVFHGDTNHSPKDSVTSETLLRPVRVITPEDTRFINTSRLPEFGSLTGETVDRLRALYELSGELLSAHSLKDLSEKLAQ